MKCNQCGGTVFYNDMLEMYLHIDQNGFKGHELDYHHDGEPGDEQTPEQEQEEEEGGQEEQLGDDLELLSEGGYGPDSDIY
jgi:hypothetical protein